MATVSAEVANDLKGSAVSEGIYLACWCTSTELSGGIPSLLYSLILLKRQIAGCILSCCVFVLVDCNYCSRGY